MVRFSSILALVVVLTVQFQRGDSLNTKEAGRDDFYYDVFPEDFLWGYATSAYQIEGGWDADGKGESIWDRASHTIPGFIQDNTTGDVACDSYNKYKEHVKLLKDSKADFYRFSLSWARILPDGTTNNVNQGGIDYYNNLIDELVANGIQPFVTLFHWDLPQALSENVGYWDDERLVHLFANYSRVAFEHFGDRVKLWLTFNEPIVFCNNQWAYPNGYDISITPYLAHHNVIKAHGLAFRIYEAEFMPQQQGQVGISLNTDWAEPLDGNKADDWAASHRFLQFRWGMFATPVTSGKYPDVMRKNIDAKSLAEGRNESRLQHFDAYWTKIINGSAHFLGLNHYTSALVETRVHDTPGLYDDVDTAESKDPEWPQAAIGWLYEVPFGLRRLLKWIAMNYNNMPIFVTENGYSDFASDGVDDALRTNYYRKYVNEMLKAVKIDGVNLKGYAAWSLLDNMEWNNGYTVRFGVHYINFSDPNLTAVPKDSARMLTQVFQDNGFPVSH